MTIDLCLFKFTLTCLDVERQNYPEITTCPPPKICFYPAEKYFPFFASGYVRKYAGFMPFYFAKRVFPVVGAGLFAKTAFIDRSTPHLFDF